MSQPNDPPRTERLVSLDVFRGMTIAGMILVNNPGGGRPYAPLRHAAWHGFTPTDLVFPSFLFIAGVAIPMALGKRLARGDSPSELLAKVVRRSVLIFAIGLLLNAFPFDRSLATLRIPGVLQRIALCYLAAALLYLYANRRALVAITLGLLLGYWALLTFVPVPGVGAGDLTRPNNLAAWVDRGLMPGHLYKPDYDPEGLLSTLPAIATTLIGVLTGLWLAWGKATPRRFLGICAAGALMLPIGYAWGEVFPINKALWTSSFVIYAAGWSLLLFGVVGLLIEGLGLRGWAWPFVVFGANPLAAFVLSGLLARVLTLVRVAGPSGDTITLKGLIYTQAFAPWADPSLASFLYALCYVLFWLAVMAIFYRFKVFLRL